MQNKLTKKKKLIQYIKKFFSAFFNRLNILEQEENKIIQKYSKKLDDSKKHEIRQKLQK